MGWTPRRRPGYAILLGSLVGMLAGCSSAGDAGSDAAAADTSRYKPEVDEGLGASIAILLDNSASMGSHARGDKREKYIVAREALQTMLAATDSFAAAQPDLPINVGLYAFSSDVTP